MRNMDLELERQLVAREARRLAADARALRTYERKARKAEAMIGEIVHDGESRFYVWPLGGRYREGSRYDLIEFLIRNRYV